MSRTSFAICCCSPNPDEYERNYPFDITPVTDNRPFFFYTVQPRDLWNFMQAAAPDTADYKINNAVPLLFGLMAISMLATAADSGRAAAGAGHAPAAATGRPRFLLYFLFIGAGYILIEVALIQKFVLFLGHPTYALTVVIFSMLVSSGLGSYFSRRVLGERRRPDDQSAGFDGAVDGAGRSRAFVPAFRLVWLPLSLKMAMTVGLIAPLGFVMGMPFPTGSAAARGVAPAERPLGVDFERRRQRARIGRRDGVRDLPGIGGDADFRRRVLSRRAGDHRPRTAARSSRAGARSGAGRAGAVRVALGGLSGLLSS